ncbi:short-chain dehydrogenase/reductase [Capsulimonas corticalis]|uniref:Short-chain dehydrogenase/reductase n=1 Tax=Capsulimonas corticalis TaxID=2219043 RepID=A0A402CU63_9BACT|nr:oxidoreductase [Capsulimonas corticalis]BDI28854.1 short-chain dehydrogenase/reductase [Capsulimonas corticalis]
MSKVYIITGTSTGFGRALAEAALEHGDKVVVTARKPEAVAELVQKYPDTALAVRLDVTNDADRQAVVSAALEKFGRIDVLVNNAGRGSLGAAEEFSLEQLRDQMEVNFFGAAEMVRAVLPAMRRQRGGNILNLTSIGGQVGYQGFAAYCASKFALEGYSESLRNEVSPLGIHVTIVEPGAFRTDFAGDSNMRAATEIDDYKPVIEPIRQYLYGNAGQQPGDPRKAAAAMIQAVESSDPPLRLILGADAYGLLAQKRAASDQELDAWRKIGEDTAIDGAEVRAVGG